MEATIRSVHNARALTLGVLVATHAGTALAQVVPVHVVEENVETRPNPGLIQASDGNIYGTTRGFNLRDGSIFKISCGTNQYTTLRPFSGSDELVSGLVEGPDGLLYGTVLAGSAANELGSVYRISPSGRFEPLHVFNGEDGANPAGPVVVDAEGVVYGTTSAGGLTNVGVVFRLTPGGEFTVLHDFALEPAVSGSVPRSRLVLGADGRLYGTTLNGGQFGEGTLFAISTDGEIETVAAFGGASGEGPHDLLQAPNGRFYGRAFGGQGLIFEVGSDGLVSTLHALAGTDGDFDFNAGDGEAAGGALSLGADGKLYGTAPRGGAGDGTVFELDFDGTLTVVATLDGSAINSPKGVLLGNDGNLYFTHARGVAKILRPGAASETLICPPSAPAEPDADGTPPAVEPGDAESAGSDAEPTPDASMSPNASAEDEAAASNASPSTAGADEEAEDDAGPGIGCTLRAVPAGGRWSGLFALLGLVVALRRGLRARA